MGLTKRKIDLLQPGEKDFTAWDDAVRGLGVRVRPTGKKVFVCKYRNAEGRQRKLTLGAYGVLTLDEARKRARQMIVDAARGNDPAKKRSDAKTASRFADFAERYLREHAGVRKTPRSYKEDERMLRTKLIPKFGARKLIEITRVDVASFHQAMSDRPYYANRHLALLSKMMNLAEEWGLKPDGTNPCRHVRKYKEEKRERFLSTHEIARLWSVLDSDERDGRESPAACNAIRLLLLTGCRMSEILTLKWDYVGSGFLDLPHTKTGAQRRSISTQAQALLTSIPQVDENPYVIVGREPGSHLTDLEKPWQRIRTRAGLDDVRLHDLRHTFASVAATGGMPLRMIGELLGHTSVQTTSRYAHLADDAVKEAAGMVGRQIEAALEASTQDVSEP